MKIVTVQAEQERGVNAELLAGMINAMVTDVKANGGDVSHIELNPAECRALVKAGMAKWERTNFFYNSIPIWITAFSR